MKKLWWYVKPLSRTWRTDGRTDRIIAILISHVSTLTRNKNGFHHFYIRSIAKLSAFILISITANACRNIVEGAKDVQFWCTIVLSLTASTFASTVLFSRIFHSRLLSHPVICTHLLRRNSIQHAFVQPYCQFYYVTKGKLVGIVNVAENELSRESDSWLSQWLQNTEATWRRGGWHDGAVQPTVRWRSARIGQL